MLYISRIFYECFVGVTGKYTARIGRFGRLMTGTMSLKVTSCGQSQISDVNMHQHNKECSLNGTYTLVDFAEMV